MNFLTPCILQNNSSLSLLWSSQLPTGSGFYCCVEVQGTKGCSINVIILKQERVEINKGQEKRDKTFSIFSDIGTVRAPTTGHLWPAIPVTQWWSRMSVSRTFSIIPTCFRLPRNLQFYKFRRSSSTGRTTINLLKKLFLFI